VTEPGTTIWRSAIHGQPPAAMTLVCVAAKTLAITHKHANFCLSANRRTRIKYNIHRNKCIEDDTKPAARQSPNCIKKTNNMANNDFRYGAWNSYTLQCDTIMTLISPGGSTLQCDTWLGNDMPLNSPKRPPYWNSTSGFDFDHITAIDMSFCTSLRNFIQIGPP